MFPNQANVLPKACAIQQHLDQGPMCIKITMFTLESLVTHDFALFFVI